MGGKDKSLILLIGITESLGNKHGHGARENNSGRIVSDLINDYCEHLVLPDVFLKFQYNPNIKVIIKIYLRFLCKLLPEFLPISDGHFFYICLFDNPSKPLVCSDRFYGF